MLTSGTTVGGKYRVEEKIGEGGMAVVYRAIHTGLDSAVALKVLRREVLDRLGTGQLVAEARTVAPLGERCGYIVQVRDVGIDEGLGVAFLVMELLVGETLHKRLSSGPVPPAELAVYLRQLGKALDHAHRQSPAIVHRDVKPGNLFLTKDHDGQPLLKVLDFGIAKVLERATQRPATAAGTFAYAAPEQQPMHLRKMMGLGSATISPATDVWPLGLIAFEALTGGDPAEAIDKGPEAAAGDTASLLPPGFAAWFERCVAKEPKDRWPSAGEATSALAAELDPAGSSRRPSPELPGVRAPGAVRGARRPELGTSLPLDTSPGGRRPSEPERATAGRDPARPGAHTRLPLETQIPPAQASMPPAGAGASLPWSGRAKVLAGGGAGFLAAAGAVAVIALGSREPRGGEGIDAGAAGAGSSSAVAASSAAPVPPPAAASCPDGMVYIAGGTFMMGTPKDKGGYEDERPVPEVTLSPYCLDKMEVTVEAYRRCVDAKACSEPNLDGSCNWSKSDRDAHPINCVDWSQADTYCRFAKKQLPTEAQWEHAARGADGRTYPWGEEAPANRACWDGEGNDLGRGNRQSTCQVGSYPRGASPFGVLDMAGNVWEWVADWKAAYRAGTSKDYANLEKGSSSSRVVRGGSWSGDDPSNLRGANRGGSAPDDRDNLVGVRCARTSGP